MPAHDLGPALHSLAPDLEWRQGFLPYDELVAHIQSFASNAGKAIPTEQELADERDRLQAAQDTGDAARDLRRAKIKAGTASLIDVVQYLAERDGL